MDKHGPDRHLDLVIEQWPLATPMRITGFTFAAIETLIVRIGESGRVGRGEAVGVYYRGETARTMREEVERVRDPIERGATRPDIAGLLPAGGARNAVDCALWDLEAKLSGRPVWALAGLEPPRPLLTTFTCSAEAPDVMAARAVELDHARALKLKLTGDLLDAERVRAVRGARPDAQIAVDANQGLTRQSFEALLPTLILTDVILVEQPFRLDADAEMDSLPRTIPFAADESVQTAADIARLCGRFDFVNIKLDKSGGLTEALAMARKARELGLRPMVGNMIGTSLAMGPAYLVGQLCDMVDLDGPLGMASDRDPPTVYQEGMMSNPAAVWGHPDSQDEP